MKLLIVTSDLFPYLNANSSIIYRLADVLHDRYEAGIVLLGRQTVEDHTAVPYRNYPVFPITETYRYCAAIPAELPRTEKALRLLTHPSCWPYRFRRSLTRYPLYYAYKAAMAQALRKHPDIDCILCSCCPYDTLFAAAKLNLSIPLVTYKMDPWGTHFLYRADRRYWEDEQFADSRSAAIFATRPIYQDYVQGVNLASVEKVHPVEFPNLRLPAPLEGFDPFDKDRIHCAYVGQMYTDIRSPNFLLELFHRLERENIVLHIIGNRPQQAREFAGRLSSNIILHGWVSAQEASAYMQAADVLVNIGNTVANQMPSKLIDYISCGKPILNLCKIPECLTLPYLEKYPAALTLMESEGLPNERVAQVADFCASSRENALSFDEVARLFPECTPDYVGEQVYKVLREVISSEEGMR